MVACHRFPFYRMSHQKRIFEGGVENTYICDIVERYSLRGNSLIRNLVKVISTNVGSIVNPTKIANTFRTTMKSSIQPITLSSYIGHMEDSFLINLAGRYDLQGRKFIGASYKYYFEDMGLRYAASTFVGKNQEPHCMENIIYNELIYEGITSQSVSSPFLSIQTTRLQEQIL